MRVRALVLFAAGLVLGGAESEPSVAGAPARASASASASLGTGASGDLGRLTAHGDRRRSETTDADSAGIRIADGDLAVRASRSGGLAVASATAVARSVEVFDGLVTAYGVRRSVEADGARRTLSGRVAGLKIEGRTIGDVTVARRYTLSSGGSVTVNHGTSALRVSLTRAVDGFPAGSTVTVAAVAASAVDGAAPRPSPTPTPQPTPMPTPPRPEPSPRPAPSKPRAKAPKPKLERRRAPKIVDRLTAKRFAFPVFARAASAADDFGAPREIGAHQGNDVFAAFGAPVLAVTDGVLFKVGTLPISGNRLWLRSDAGDEFFYAHLSAFSPAAVNGRRVRAGQVLGFTGNTGDAEPTPPHLHFEIHPGGGDAIDPHAILTAWQLKRDVPPGAWLTRYGSDTEQRPGALVEVRDFIAGG